MPESCNNCWSGFRLDITVKIRGKKKMVAIRIRNGRSPSTVVRGNHGHQLFSRASQRWISEIDRTITNKITEIADPPEISCLPYPRSTA